MSARKTAGANPRKGTRRSTGSAASDGADDKRALIAAYMTEMYAELRQLAAVYMSKESPFHTLQPTALVNEVYLKFERQKQLQAQSRTHFLALAALAMRQVLKDHARIKGAAKRGGGKVLFVTLDEVTAVSSRRDEAWDDLQWALEKLEKDDPRAAKVAVLRFFGGLTEPEIAAELGLSERTVREDWTYARAYLRKELSTH
jgi:RNA polymerase sigma factor (TIGR02999 family)